LQALQHGQVAPEVRDACFELAVSLRARDEALCREAATIGVEKMEKTTDPNTLGSLAAAVASWARRLAPAEAARGSGRAGPRFLGDSKKEEIPEEVMVSGLGTLAPSLGPGEVAAASCRRLRNVLLNTNNPAIRQGCASAVKVLAEHLSPQEAAQQMVVVIGNR